MAAAISGSVSSGSVGAALLDIDDHSRNSGSAKTPEITIGPFGLFDSNPDPGPTVSTNLRSNTNPDGQATLAGEESQLLPSFCHPPNSGYDDLPLIGVYEDGSVAPDCDGYLAWTDLFALDFETTLGLPQTQSSVYSDLLGQGIPAQKNPVQPRSSTAILPSEDQSRKPLSHSLSENVPNSTDWRSPKITFLLRHFYQAVIPRMASVPLGKKYAWGPMNHELAVQTQADVTYLEKPHVNEAKLANLCAIVAISAYHLHITGYDSHQPPEDWLQFSRKQIRDADVYFNRSLELEIRGSKAAKYKEQLMAIQALMAYSWATADSTEARRYQLETERLVRFRGLAKRDISRRIRLLHHAYTWNRIVGESTYVLHDYGNLRRFISASFGEPQIADWREDGSSPNHTDTHHTRENTRLDDFLRIRHSFEEVDRSIEGYKDAHTGNQDIHLEDPRNSVEDGFHIIYGVPERWLSLLSRTTRLANWLDANETLGRLGGNRLSETLERRAQSLEDAICAFVGGLDVAENINANEPPNCGISSLGLVRHGQLSWLAARQWES
ncbi:unnamed protein product [Clonostachys byssicola]|uniref:Uncharacterized protein n=1 Tax=Clonostachys byssicola TaxID=160290 RepID=A0A9N9UJM7_9HYPO|nr:unnamed protein product [Clonostachys byssicola]